MNAATAIESDFQLQFAPMEIPTLARLYMDGGSEEDERAFAAGTRIRGGDFSRDNLQAIFRWKTKGSASASRCKARFWSTVETRA